MMFLNLGSCYVFDTWKIFSYLIASSSSPWYHYSTTFNVLREDFVHGMCGRTQQKPLEILILCASLILLDKMIKSSRTLVCLVFLWVISPRHHYYQVVVRIRAQGT